MKQHASNIELVDEDEEEQRAPQGAAPRRVVTIENKDTGDTIRLRVPTSETVVAVIDVMYVEFRLSREADDRLTCRHNGTDVYQYTGMTVAEYIRAGHCPDLHWSFASDTGGA